MLDPSVGRWLEEDPILFGAGDPNLYRPMGNDPANLSDPNGLEIPGPRYDPFRTGSFSHPPGLLQGLFQQGKEVEAGVRQRAVALAARADEHPWDKETVVDILSLSPIGRETLRELRAGKLAVYRVAHIYEYFRRRDAVDKPWTDWKIESAAGWAPYNEGVVYILNDSTNLTAAMTLVHEVTHTGQTARGFGPDPVEREMDAHTRETQFLLSLAQYGFVEKASDRYRKFFQKVGDTYMLNSDAIRTFVEGYYGEKADRKREPDAGLREYMTRAQFRTEMKKEPAELRHGRKQGDNDRAYDFGGIKPVDHWVSERNP
jgi:hypothetical protein